MSGSGLIHIIRLIQRIPCIRGFVVKVSCHPLVHAPLMTTLLVLQLSSSARSSTRARVSCGAPSRCAAVGACRGGGACLHAGGTLMHGARNSGGTGGLLPVHMSTSYAAWVPRGGRVPKVGFPVRPKICVLAQRWSQV